MTPPFWRTVIRIPGWSWRCSRAPRGRTSWYLLDRITVSIVLQKSYRSQISKSTADYTSRLPAGTRGGRIGVGEPARRLETQGAAQAVLLHPRLPQPHLYVERP